MNEEEWIFLIIVISGGVLAGAVIINDLFSLQKFWARLLRSRNPPTPETIAKAYTRHQRFYHHTHQRLFSTTYVSFYLFGLSFLGIMCMNAFIFFQDLTTGSDFKTDERLLRLGYIFFFFLWSRWCYRQESHYTTLHKLVAILSCVIIIDLVHLITGADYVQVTVILVLFWVWIIGVSRAVMNYEVDYARDIAFSAGIPVAVMYYLITANAGVILLIIAPLFVLALGEFITNSKKYSRIERMFNRLPFKSFQPHSFRKDVLYSMSPWETFAECSFWEVLFWFSLTPVVLIPVTLYLQSREEQLHKQHDAIMKWSQNEYVLDPETVADRLGLTLEDTYPLLNEITEEGKLTLYESPHGLRYGLPPSEEMDAIIKKVNLRKTELPQKDRDLLEYLIGKRRIVPPKIVLLSVTKRTEGVEVSTERVGGTISALKFSTFADTGKSLERVSHDINSIIGTAVQTLSYFGHYTTDTFFSSLQEKGKELLKTVIPEKMLETLEMSHLILETNCNDIPFELMWADQFFAVKYAIGRRLRISGTVKPEMNSAEDVERLRALIIADPTSNLREAIRECDYLEAQLSRLVDTCYIQQTEATCTAVRDHLRSGYTIIHYAGHITESGLLLSDGVLDSAAIQKTCRGRPIVFANGCKSAGMINTRLAEAFLQGGAVGYIGSFWDIHDVAAAQLAIDFYIYSLHYTIGEALRMAKEKAFQKNNSAWVCFVLFGDPTLRLI
jgi:hypothetical protein